MKSVITVIIVVIFLSACKKDNVGPNNQPNSIVVTSDSTYNYTIDKNIIYGEGLRHQTLNSVPSSAINLKLDAYIPDNSIGKRPAIILIHGGGFYGGSKQDAHIVSLAGYFASRGWVAFSIDYRLEDDKGTVPNEWIPYIQNNVDSALRAQYFAIYPANRDAKAAVRWVVANAKNYNIDTGYITVGGGSAGAIIANTIGISNLKDYTDEIPISIDPTLSSTSLGQSYKIRTILDFWGSPLGVDLLNDIYGYQRFDSTDAPILIAHGTEDNTVDFSNAEELRNEYITTGVDYAFYPLVGEGHGAWGAMVNGKTLQELAFDFMVKEQNLSVH